MELKYMTDKFFVEFISSKAFFKNKISVNIYWHFRNQNHLYSKEYVLKILLFGDIKVSN